MPPINSRPSAALRSSLLRLYLPAALCFLVINLTNDTILRFLNAHHRIYGADPDPAANFEKTARFFLIPAKSFIFFVGTAILLTPFALEIVAYLRARLTRSMALGTLGAMGVSLLLTATMFPGSYGRSYARISTDPFNQTPDQLYRRLLLPGLANLYHVDGFFYVFLFWAVLFLAALLGKAYLREHGLPLTLVQEVSLLTTGIFVSSFQVPGYPEIAVFLLALGALIAFEREGHAGPLQIAAFALALMAHEACAVIVFAPMIVFLFGRRVWLPSVSLLVLYVVALLANFSFDPRVPLHTQTMVSDTPAHVFFLQSPGTVVLAAAYAFKLLWVLVPVGIFWLSRVKTGYAAFAAAGFALALASTYIAVDYSRIIQFATLPLLLCVIETHRHLPTRTFNTILAANILVPSFYIGGNTGLLTFRGLYFIVYRLLVHLPAPR